MFNKLFGKHKDNGSHSLPLLAKSDLPNDLSIDVKPVLNLGLIGFDPLEQKYLKGMLEMLPPSTSI